MSDADSTAKLDFIGDSRSAEAAYNKLTKENAKLREDNRKLVDEFVKGADHAKQAASSWADQVAKLGKAQHDVIQSDAWQKAFRDVEMQSHALKKQVDQHSQIKHWLSEQSRELIGIGAGYLTIEKGLDLVVGMYDKWREKARELGREHTQLAGDIVRTLYSAGLLKHGAEVEEFIEKGPGGGTQQQRRAAVAGVTAGAPNADLETVKRLSEETVKAAPLGTDLAARGTFIAKLHTIAPEKSADDLADIATFAKQRAGNKADQLTDPAFLRAVRALKAGGMGTDEALALGVGALQNDAQMKQFTKVGELLDQDNKFAPTGNPHRLTPEERLKQQFGRLSSEDRLKELMAGGKMARAVAGDESFKLRMIPADQQADIVRGLQQAQTGNADRADLDRLQTFRSGREALEEQGLSEEESELERLYGPKEAARERFRRRYAARAYKRGGSAYVSQQLNEMLRHVPGLGGDMGTRAEAREALGEKLITQAEYDRLSRALEQNTESTKRNTAAAGPARVNINGNNEGGH
jgi:hypothetical protein